MRNKFYLHVRGHEITLRHTISLLYDTGDIISWIRLHGNNADDSGLNIVRSKVEF